MIKEQLKDLDFGDYVTICQKRHGVNNEDYLHKVIGVSKSNCWVDVPVESPRTETRHSNVVPVVECICCGVGETEVLRYRYEEVYYCESKCKNQDKDNQHNFRTFCKNCINLNKNYEECLKCDRNFSRFKRKIN